MAETLKGSPDDINVAMEDYLDVLISTKNRIEVDIDTF
jgi:hypothetical protein